MRTEPAECNAEIAYLRLKRWLPFIVVMAILFPNSSIRAKCTQQAAPQGSAHNNQDLPGFDLLPMTKFLHIMIQKLDIAKVIVDQVSLEGSIKYPKNAPLSRQDLLNLFIAGLRENNAVLVKAESVYQIVPLSRLPGDGLNPVIDAVTILPVLQAPRRVHISLNFKGIELSEFCAVMTQMLHIAPIDISPEIHGRVTVLSSPAIAREELFPVLLAVLKNFDAKIIESSGQYKILPIDSDMTPEWKILIIPPDPQIGEHR